MADAQTSGWFRHRRSGQVFEAEGYAYREALKNRDLEAVDEPGKSSDQSPPARLVALRERVAALGLPWEAGDGEDGLNARLEEHATVLRAQLDQLKVRHLPNWKPETLAAKVTEATAKAVQVPATAPPAGDAPAKTPRPSKPARPAKPDTSSTPAQGEASTKPAE